MVGVALSDSDAKSSKVVGDVLTLFSAFAYGCYMILLKVKIGDEKRVHMAMFFGFLGVFNVLCMWPFFFVLHYSGLEPFVWPDGSVLWRLAINALIGTVLSDFLWLWSVLLTSPLISTLGMSLTTPFAMLGQLMGLGSNSTPVTAVFAVSAIAVLAGFFLANIPDYKLSLATSQTGLHADVSETETDKVEAQETRLVGQHEVSNSRKVLKCLTTPLPRSCPSS